MNKWEVNTHNNYDFFLLQTTQVKPKSIHSQVYQLVILFGCWVLGLEWQEKRIESSLHILKN